MRWLSDKALDHLRRLAEEPDLGGTKYGLVEKLDEQFRLFLGTRILIVEDQPFVAFAATDMIEGLGGIVVEVAATVEQGIEACARGEFEMTTCGCGP